MEEITITIQGSGLSFTGTTDFFKAGQIIAFLNTPQGSYPANSAMIPIRMSQQPVLGSSRKSPREAILDASAKTNAQKITVLADYLLQDGGKTTFSIGEIKPLFARAGEPVPKNFRRDMKEAVRACYIHESIDRSGEYELTEKASELIQKKIQGEEVKKTRRRSSGSTNSNIGKKKELNSALVEMEISTQMDGFIPFHSLPKKSQKILWILTYAKNRGIDSLNTSEIEFLADKLNENITTSLFAALNGNNLKNGYVSRKNDKYKIIQSGIDTIATSEN